jgi:hypothetical protein
MMTNDDREVVPPAPLLRSVRFVAERHDWTIPFVYHLIKAGHVKAYRQGEKLTVVDVNSADAYAVSRPLDLTEHVPVAALRARAIKRAAAKAARTRAKSPSRRRKHAAEHRTTP